LIKENYPSVRLQTSNQPVDFTSSKVEITTDSIEGWTIVPSRKPTVCELLPGPAPVFQCEPGAQEWPGDEATRVYGTSIAYQFVHTLVKLL
jgi:hypothetical protein